MFQRKRAIQKKIKEKADRAIEIKNKPVQTFWESFQEQNHEYYREFGYFFWVIVIVSIGSAILGISSGIQTGVYIFSTLTPSCGSVYGMECNYPFGECTEDGVCICVDPRWSGTLCETSACDVVAGFDRRRGQEQCNGRGFCAPFMQYDALYESCKWINPTRNNSFVQSSTGWTNKDCISYLLNIRSKIELGREISVEEAATYPACVCQIPWHGVICETDTCPQNVASEICSGNGNISVGYVANDTGTVELGCQCRHMFTVKDLLDSITEEAAMKLVQQIPEGTGIMCGELEVPEPKRSDGTATKC